MTRKIDTVVVGIAMVRREDPVLEPAIRLAASLGAHLHVVHVFELPDPLLSAYGQAGYLGEDFGRDHGDALRADLEKMVAAHEPASPVTCHAVLGSPAELLCRTAGKLDADLILVGSTREGKLARKILGTTADRVIRHAHLPVLVMRRGGVVEPRRVLLTTDLTESNAGPYELGYDLAHALNPGSTLELRCLLAIWYGLTLPPPLKGDLARQMAERELERFLEARGERGHGVEQSVRIGTPAEEIVREAREWECDLLVLGTHSRHGLGRLFFGSVAAASARDAFCDVLVVPPTKVPAETHASSNDLPLEEAAS